MAYCQLLSVGKEMIYILHTERKINPRTSESPQKEKAVLETANIILFALAESSKIIRSQTNFIL